MFPGRSSRALRCTFSSFRSSRLQFLFLLLTPLHVDVDRKLCCFSRLLSLWVSFPVLYFLNSRVFYVPFPVCQEEDVDFLAKFSRLVNGMGQSLVLSWTKLAKGGNAKAAGDTLQAMEAKVPLLLQLLVHEDDDISANIVCFCYEYLHVLKQVSQEGPKLRCPAEGTDSSAVSKAPFPPSSTIQFGLIR